MATIGVRELRQQTSELLRRVKEEQAEYVVTYQGRPVAVLLPLDADAIEAAILQVGKRGAGEGWDAYAQVVERVRAAWPEQTSTQALTDEIRS